VRIPKFWVCISSRILCYRSYRSSNYNPPTLLISVRRKQTLAISTFILNTFARRLLDRVNGVWVTNLYAVDQRLHIFVISEHGCQVWSVTARLLLKLVVYHRPTNAHRHRPQTENSNFTNYNLFEIYKSLRIFKVLLTRNVQFENWWNRLEPR